MMGSVCVVVETAAANSSLPSDWVELQKNGKKYYFNSKLNKSQWKRPPAPAAPLQQRNYVVLHTPGYLKGATPLHSAPLRARCCLFDSRLLVGAEEFFSRVCAADSLVLLRQRKIAGLIEAASGSTTCENAEDTQNAFDRLFMRVCEACSDMSVEQSIQITNHIMGSIPLEVLSALSTVPSSAASSKMLAHLVHSAAISLKVE
jgi:hypothetical protein